MFACVCGPSYSNYCPTCAAGYYCPNLGGVTRVLPCAAGTYAPTNVSTCRACSVGTFAGDAAAVACTSCPTGSYAASTGLSVCTACDIGAYCNGTGLVAQTGQCTAGPSAEPGEGSTTSLTV